MISFWRQLKFLLWKAYLIKWRQKFWLIVELLVPLLLFAMLALIRTRDFSDPRPLCHYDSKGMMSAGLLPFLHSMFCSLGNNCNRVPTTGDDGFYINNGTAKNESAIVDILYYGSLQLRAIGENPEHFNQTVQQVVNLVELMAKFNETQLAPVKLTELLNFPEPAVALLLQDLGVTENMAKAIASSSITTAFVTSMTPMIFQILTGESEPFQNFTNCLESNALSLFLDDQVDCPLNMSLLCNPFIFDRIFIFPKGTTFTSDDRRSLCEFRPSSDALLKLSALRKNLTRGPEASKPFTGKITSLMDLANSVKSLYNWFQLQPISQLPLSSLKLTANTTDLISALFCGQNPFNIDTGGLKPTPKGAETPFNKLKDKLVDFLKKVVPGKEKKHDKDYCGKVPVRLDTNCSQVEAAVLSKLQPIIQGYILVAPSSPAVKKLVKRLEEPLRNFDALRRILFEWPGMADAFQNALHASDFYPASQNALVYIKDHIPIPPSRVQQIEFFLEHAFANSSDPNSIGAVTKQIAMALNVYTKCIATDRFFLVDSEDEMETSAVCLSDYAQYYSGISFVNHSINATEFDPFVTYKIRQLPDLVDSTNGLMDGRRPFSRDMPFTDLKYLTYGFSFIQESVDRALIQEITGKNATVGTFAQQEPYPCVVQDIFNVSNFLGLCIILSFIIPAALLVKNIVLEKELKLKEQMRIMGLGDAVHCISWAIAAFVLNFLSVLAISLILRYGKVLRHVDISLLLVVLLLFALSSISMSLFVSTFFSNANMATAATTIIYFLFLFPFQLSVKTKSSAFSKFTLIFPQTVICYAAKMIAESDVWADGAKWKFMDKLYLEEYDVSLAECMIALACETVGFWILSWYLSAIFPGVYGISQPWYFPFTKVYWFPATEFESQEESDPEFDKIYASDMFEHDPTEGKMTVRIAGLTKVYGNGTKALDALYMRLYESQITALLGHNGAGKTTTMSMLCGLYSPTSGAASVYGRDLRKEMRRVRDVLGVCPQQNVLFSLLTVREQLCFFAALKGTDPDKLYAAANEILEAVCLTEKADCLAETLSGGQKRRLCIGIALIGGSKFVILDEPTAGVDVNSRKDIWRLLQKNKTGRTILLSTHHMDEADVLSDRVAVLSEGQLITLGSPVFLKRRFGESLQLVACKMEKRGEYKQSQLAVLVDSPLKGLIKVQDTNDDEVIYSIPIETDSILLEKFFTWFESSLQGLRYSDYGISAPTLQQIFIRLAPQREYNVPKEYKGCWSRFVNFFKKRRVGVQADQTALIPVFSTTPSTPQVGLSPSNSQETLGQENEYDFEPPPPVEGFTKTKEHVQALLACRAQYTKRNKKTLLFEVILPVCLLLAAEIYAIIALPSSKQLVTVSQAPLPLVSQLIRYNPDSYVNLWDQNSTTFAHGIVKSLVTSPGFGTICAEGAPEAYAVLKKLLKKRYSDYDAVKNFVVANCKDRATGEWIWEEPTNVTYNANLTCECSASSRWNCTMEDYPLWEQNMVFLNTSDRIWDFTGRNLSQFGMDTIATHNASNYAPYFIGGFSLGHHSLRAASPNQVKQAQDGWRIALQDLASAAPQVRLNLSGVPASSLPIYDNFSDNITLTDVLNSVVANLDVEENVKLWFNNKVWPAYPIYLNGLSNALLRLVGKEIDPQKLGILTINQPMNETVNEALSTNAVQKVITFRIILILMVLCTVPAGFTVFLVEDRTSGSLHMQMVSGLAKTTYWLTGYVFDFFIYFLSCLTILLIYVIFGVKEFCFNGEVFFSYLLLFILYGLCAILWAYCLQRRFSVAALSFILISIGTFFLGAISTLTVIIIEQLMQTDPTMATSHAVCSYVFLLLPQYNLGMAIFRGAAAYQLMLVGKQFLEQVNRLDLVSQLPIPNELDWDMMGLHCVALLTHIFLALLVLVVMEHGSFGFLRRTERKNATALMVNENERDEDEDVAAERQRVNHLIEGESPLIVKDLIKCYSKQQLAVKGVSFAVESGECFGLLGLNGAGKTTTFGMLTGKIYSSGGTVTINGVTVERGASVAFAQVGYCPQFDALNSMLTTKENLVFFARIRAIPEEAIEELADRLLKALHLRPYAGTLTSALSGGNKRKLSVAISLISQPSLILLDEPSAGMDPGSQQFLWRVIEKLRKSGKAVVMTSHSMEECEALCTRIAIMDRGRIRCLGSKQHLKNKFGEGYSLTLKLISLEECELARSYVKHELPAARLEAVHCSSLFYHIERGAMTIAEIMKAVNKVKQKVQLEDYSLSQATLDEVFQCLSERAESTSIVSVPSVGQLTQSTNISNE